MERVALLADASGILASSLDPHSALSRFAGRVVPEFADWCTIFIRDAAGIQPAAIVHRNPELVDLARQLHQFYPLDSKQPHAVSASITGKATRVENITDEFLADYCQDERQWEIYRKLGIRS